MVGNPSRCRSILQSSMGSPKLIRSHWENNYIGSVKTLNMISERIAAAIRDPELPPVVYGGLKREELHRVGSVILHEQYLRNQWAWDHMHGAIAGVPLLALDMYEHSYHMRPDTRV